MDISIIIPLYNEADSLQELHIGIKKALDKAPYTYEVLFIDDGSTDNSWDIITEITNTHSNSKGVLFAKNFGKSQALYAGFKKAKGRVIITLDGDLQDSPEEIIPLYSFLNTHHLDLVSGWKKKRYDSFLFKKLPSKFFNLVARKVSGIKIHDFNCGIKAYKKEALKNIVLYGEMHRYIPILIANEGYDKIGEKEVRHQARKYGKTKFGASRFMHGFLDLLSLWFLTHFSKKPMYFFGFAGSLMFFIGFLFTLYLGIDKLFLNIRGRLITQRPEFYISLITMVLGTQFFIAGFLGEILLRQNKNKLYTIIKKINFTKK